MNHFNKKKFEYVQLNFEPLLRECLKYRPQANEHTRALDYRRQNSFLIAPQATVCVEVLLI